MNHYAAAAMMGVALLYGCGQGVQPLDQVVFNSEPLKQIELNAQTFKQIPVEDLNILLAYLGANEKAILEQKQHSNIDGKPLAQVMQEAKAWHVGMMTFLEKSKEISFQLGKMVVVAPALKAVEDNDSAVSKSQLLRISYQLSNKSERTVTGVAGTIKYYWQDGRVAATIPLSFEGQIGPGEAINLFGHQPIIVGSRAAKEMIDFAKAPLTDLRFEVITQAIRLDGGEIISVPLL